jgi:hypothetical protein
MRYESEHNSTQVSQTMKGLHWAITIGAAALVAVIALAIGSGFLRPRDRSGEIITDMVVDPEELVERYGMTIASLYYLKGDARGWPVREDHRRYIHYLQTHGIEIAFQHQVEDGYYVMLIPRPQVDDLVELNHKAESFGVKRPDPTEELRALSAAKERSNVEH